MTLKVPRYAIPGWDGREGGAVNGRETSAFVVSDRTKRLPPRTRPIDCCPSAFVENNIDVNNKNNNKNRVIRTDTVFETNVVRGGRRAKRKNIRTVRVSSAACFPRDFVDTRGGSFVVVRRIGGDFAPPPARSRREFQKRAGRRRGSDETFCLFVFADTELFKSVCSVVASRETKKKKLRA